MDRNVLYHRNRHNEAPELQQLYQFREPFEILDNTFLAMDHLEGGRLYSSEEYIEIAHLLVAAGVRRTVFLTNQYPGTLKDENVWEGLRAVAKEGLNLKLQAFGFFIGWKEGAYPEYIDKMIDHGIKVVQLSAYTPSLMRIYNQEQSAPLWDLDAATRKWEERMRELPEALDYAKKRGLEVWTSYAHAVLDDLDTVTKRLNHYIEMGFDGLGLSDSKGYLTPEATRLFVKKVREGLVKDVPIWYHGHDCFGLGTALGLAAASGGAYPQASTNGTGDRGLTSLEELAVSLEVLYGIKTGIRLDQLSTLCSAVERITGIYNPPYKAIVGDTYFVPGYPARLIGALQGKSFLDMDLVPIDPSLVGKQPRLIMSYALLNDSTVKAKLKQMGLPSDPEKVERARQAIEQKLDSLGNRFPVLIEDKEVGDICQRVLGSARSA